MPHAHCTKFFIEKGDHSMFQHILVPLDGSEEARKALALAVAIAEKFGARLTLLYAVDLNANMSGLDRVTMSGYIPETILETTSPTTPPPSYSTPSQFS